MYNIPQKPPAADLLKGKRALVTNAEEYMGPAIMQRFTEEGAVVIPVKEKFFRTSGDVDRVVAEAGHIDILVVNQAVPGVHSASDQIDDSYWNDVMLSCPTNTMWYVRAVLRQMLPRKSGKIVAVTSGAAIYGAPQSAAYACGRGAQNVFLSTVAHEVASDNVIINVIAQNIVKNPTFWSDKTIDTPYIREMLRRDVPAGRFAEGWETADLAVFLASDRNNFMSGQVLEFTGGWVTWSRDEMGRPWGDNAARGQTIREG